MENHYICLEACNHTSLCANNYANKVNQPDILFASALKMTGYLRRYAKNKWMEFN